MIYFYGGAFNPLTKAHQQIIDDIINNKININNDSLILGVTSHDYKEYDYNQSLRYDMVYNYMFNKYVPLMEKNIFIKWQVLHQYIRTYKFLEKLYPNQQKNIIIVLGEDEWNDLNDKKWEYSDELLNEYKFEVIPRTNNISSTKVRELLSNNSDYNTLSEYISEEVYNMIK